MKDFDPLDWFWIVGGDETKAYSSKAGDYLQVDAVPYEAWLSEGGIPTKIASEEELSDVLRVHGLRLPVCSVADVKAEAQRRIEAIMPPYKQSNFHAQFAETAMAYGVDPSGWPPELQQVLGNAMAQWGQIKAIRARSNEIEAMNPIPHDLSEDELWA